MENFTVSILIAAYNHFIDPFLYIITAEGQFDVLITLNVHAVRKRMCLVTTKHADRRGKPLFFCTFGVSLFSGPQESLLPPSSKVLYKILWSERCMTLYMTGSHSFWRDDDDDDDHMTNSWRERNKASLFLALGQWCVVIMS
jgi:hypothetical protein